MNSQQDHSRKWLRGRRKHWVRKDRLRLETSDFLVATRLRVHQVFRRFHNDNSYDRQCL